MPADEFLCVRCARYNRTCCQRSEIYTTPADEQRIRNFTGRDDFTGYRRPDNVEYAGQDNDPVWRDRVFRADGSRRVLNRQPNGDCTFLGPHGCVLPLEIRPLVCRLYPYDYEAAGIREELSHGCPLELLRSGQGLIVALEMNIEDARRWHQQLYQEVQNEVHG